MRIDRGMHSRLAIAGAVTLLAGFVALRVITASVGAAGPIDPRGFALPAEDRGRLTDVVIGEPPTTALPHDEALKMATEYYDPEALGANQVALYLATISAPGTDLSPSPIRERGVWILALDGMSQVQPGPIGEDGTPGSDHVLQRAYVFIDALTGEFLFAEWQE